MILINTLNNQPSLPAYKLFVNRLDTFSLNKAVQSDTLSLRLFHYDYRKRRITAVDMRGYTQFGNTYFIDKEAAKTAVFSVPVSKETKSFDKYIFDNELIKIRKTLEPEYGYHYVRRRNGSDVRFIASHAREKYYIGLVDKNNKLVSNLVKYKTLPIKQE